MSDIPAGAVEAVIDARAHRWGYDEMDPGLLGAWKREQAEDPNLYADLAAALPHLRERWLAEVEAVAQRFHEAYERLAPDFGYRTREASAKPWDEVPEQNRALMIAVCAELLPALRERWLAEAEQALRDEAPVRAWFQRSCAGKGWWPTWAADYLRDVLGADAKRGRQVTNYGWDLCRHEWKGIHGERHVCAKTLGHFSLGGLIEHECACGLPMTQIIKPEPVEPLEPA